MLGFESATFRTKTLETGFDRFRQIQIPYQIHFLGKSNPNPNQILGKKRLSTDTTRFQRYELVLNVFFERDREIARAGEREIARAGERERKRERDRQTESETEACTIGP